jgi:hypothetical protein
MNRETKLYLYNFSYNGYQDDFLNSLEPLSPGASFFIKLSRRFKPNRLIARTGEWSLPWPQQLIPKFSMPEYDPSFSCSFEDVTDRQALKIKKRIQSGDKFALMYSGGIDSTTVLVSLLKNLTKEELQSISICCSLHSVAENPMFWSKFIEGNFNILDSNSLKYNNLFDLKLIPITADEGDPIFGTMAGLDLFLKFDRYVSDLSPASASKLKNLKSKMISGELHYSLFKDLIINHLNSSGDVNFAKALYEKLVVNIKTSRMPIHSVHDFFWWFIFNIKYLNCSIRGPVFFNDSEDFKYAIDNTYNWYNDVEYQLWSMNNNNNGTKIQSGISTYKTAARNYIFDFDKNLWYKNFKLKLESLNLVVNRQPVSNLPINRRPVSRMALDTEYNMYSLNDAKLQDYFKFHLENYKINWC